MDMGGHRFFSKVPEVNAWWEQMLPMQGAPAADDIMLQRDVPLEKGGPDPQKEDRVMLNRNRVSRIYFDQKFYDYPIQLKPELFMNMGFLQTMQVGFSYLASLIHKRPENSLEDFYINRFGKKLYSMFFEHYTENLWGRHPRDIDPSWGAQRVKGLSIIAILKDILWKIVPTKKAHQVETSLIESFRYPKLGPGALWDVTASEIEKLGGKILKGCKVVGLEKDANDHIVALTYEQDGKKIREEADVFISSMPIRDLVGGKHRIDQTVDIVLVQLADQQRLAILLHHLLDILRRGRKEHLGLLQFQLLEHPAVDINLHKGCTVVAGKPLRDHRTHVAQPQVLASGTRNGRVAGKITRQLPATRQQQHTCRDRYFRSQIHIPKGKDTFFTCK